MGSSKGVRAWCLLYGREKLALFPHRSMQARAQCTQRQSPASQPALHPSDGWFSLP